MRHLDILNITPSTNPTVPSTIELGLDYTAIFHGREWIDQAGIRSPFYTYDNDPSTAAPPPPAGTTVLVATTFEVLNNPKYNGRYTVFTKPTTGGFASSEYSAAAGRTTIRVNEAMATDGTAADKTSGSITHISTYQFTVTGEANLVVLEQSDVPDRPIEIVGRYSNGWGEIMFQNMLRQTQCFAGPAAPLNPFQGQLWFDTLNSLLKIHDISGWGVVNSAFFGGAPYRHTQSAGSTTWTIPHGMGLPAPFIASTSFFVDTGAGVIKAILPNDISFTDTNTLTATFSQAYTGYAVVRN